VPEPYSPILKTVWVVEWGLPAHTILRGSVIEPQPVVLQVASIHLLPWLIAENEVGFEPCCESERLSLLFHVILAPGGTLVTEYNEPEEQTGEEPDIMVLLVGNKYDPSREPGLIFNGSNQSFNLRLGSVELFHETENLPYTPGPSGLSQDIASSSGVPNN
jgi:hypothetical protein